MNAQRVISDLRELAARTATADGANASRGALCGGTRASGSAASRRARAHDRHRRRRQQLGHVTGRLGETVIVGSHLDSVPNGGCWTLPGRDGCARGVEMHAGATPPVTLKLVDWADEEGARFGRSLLGSSPPRAPSNGRRPRFDGSPGTRLVDALAENGIALERWPTPIRSSRRSTRGPTSSCTRAGAGARVDEQTDRRGAWDVRRRASPASLHRSGSALRVDADSHAA